MSIESIRAIALGKEHGVHFMGRDKVQMARADRARRDVQAILASGEIVTPAVLRGVSQVYHLNQQFYLQLAQEIRSGVIRVPGRQIEKRQEKTGRRRWIFSLQNEE